MAVSSVLYKKKLRNSPLCPICDDHEETIEHMLLLCPWALTQRRREAEFSVRLHTLAGIYGRLGIGWCLTITHPNPSKPSRPFSTRSVHPSTQASWAAPSKPFVKINVDAAWRKSTCRAGAGIIIRNFEGRFLGAKSVDFQAENALIAEATALWEDYKFAKERGHNMVCFESDSLELIKSVRDSFGQGSWTLYPILTLIRDEQRYFEGCRWNWNTRNCNQAADHLALLALSRRSMEVWVE
ncbi:unnamed protein product [Prunus armeniaca]